MLFNSYEFLFLFLPISFIIYFFLNKQRLTSASKGWLAFTSLFFYSWWNIVYLPLILTSILFNYSLTRSMLDHDENKKIILSKKTIFQIGLIFNVGLLGYFKYMDFFIENTNTVFDSNIQMLHLALPLAISFFTLQQIAYLVDCYEGLVKEKSFLNYTIFVAFFPQLIAGPIVHHKEMMPQFVNPRNKVKNYRNIALGLFIFSIGLFKKVVIADTFSVWASAGFDSGMNLNFFEAWATSLSYTFQLYFDFSGYTDMAIGAALLFNIKLPQNFNSPYKATGMIDFWKRWHITLTNFITTYIYTPLVRSFARLTFHKAMLSTIIAFLIAGLWHGASWMFIIFGGLNGLGIVINHYWTKKVKIKLNKTIAWYITFNFVNVTFVFFRAKEWDDALRIFQGMLFGDLEIHNRLKFIFFFIDDSKFLTTNAWLYSINGTVFTPVWIIFALFVTLISKNSSQLAKEFKPNLKYSVILIFFTFVAIMEMNKISEFLYFQF